MAPKKFLTSQTFWRKHFSFWKIFENAFTTNKNNFSDILIEAIEQEDDDFCLNIFDLQILIIRLSMYCKRNNSIEKWRGIKSIISAPLSLAIAL